jgi:hypothetical protein
LTKEKTGKICKNRKCCLKKKKDIFLWKKHRRKDAVHSMNEEKSLIKGRDQ